MPGDPWQQIANLRALYAWMWSHPGKQLLFMGGELAEPREWSNQRSLGWDLLDDPAHRGIHDLVRELNRIEAEERSLWGDDFRPSGFEWIDSEDAVHSILSFLRRADDHRPVVVVANLTPVPRHGYRLGLPSAGQWQEILSTDDSRWGGSGIANATVVAEGVPWQGQPDSAVITLPPLAIVWLAPTGAA
jgi:1,4-alpha-glucan branching enzyme